MRIQAVTDVRRGAGGSLVATRTAIGPSRPAGAPAACADRRSDRPRGEGAMIMWLIWSTCLAGVLAAAAVVLGRAVRVLGGSRRYVWVAAFLIGAVLPAFLAVNSHLDHQNPRLVLSRRTSQGHRRDRSNRSGSLNRVSRTQRTPARERRSYTSRSRIPRRGCNATLRSRRDRHGGGWWVVILWMVSSLVVLVVFVRTMRALAHRSTTWREVEIGTCRALICRTRGPP